MQDQAVAAESNLYFELVPKTCGYLHAPVEASGFWALSKLFLEEQWFLGMWLARGLFYLFKIEEHRKEMNRKDWRK